MTTNAKIKLTPAQETLLITLYARAQPDNPLFFDPQSLAILQQIDYDFARLHVPSKTVILVCQRAKKIDALTRAFLSAHPGAVVVQLGCGLDNRFWRVDDGRVSWYDLDLPEVAALRGRFFPAAARYELIASSVTDLAWVDRIEAGGRPLLLIAEGLLMYLPEADVKALLLRLHERFPGCRLVADVFSRLTARAASNHPSLKATGASAAWGLDDAREVERWAPGIRLLDEWFFSADPELARLGWGYRLAYKVAGALPVVRRAQRIVTYAL